MEKILKIDVHVHCVDYCGIELPRNESGDNYASPTQIRQKYDAWGIEYGLILPEMNPECSHILNTNENAYKIAQRFPETFRWCCNIDPRMINNSPKTDFSFCLRHYKKYGAVGVGEVCANLPADDPLLDNLFYHCGECDMPVIFHIGPRLGGCYGIYDELGLPRIESMLKKHPKLKLVGHSQPFWAEISSDVTEATRNGYPKGKVTPGRLVTLLRTYDNLFCDMSAGSGGNAFMRDPDFGCRFIEEFSDRLMFGTDICSPKNYMELSGWLDEMAESGRISAEAYRRVCRENAERLFHLV